MSRAKSAARAVASQDAWDRARKPRVAAAPDLGAYPHMAAEAARVGWPLRFAGDLHKHDRGFLAKRPPSTPILWHLGSGCTQIRDMIAPVRRGTGNTTHEWLKAVRECYPDTRVYGWDGTTLRAFASDDAAREWCAQYPDTYLLARGELQARPSRWLVLPRQSWPARRTFRAFRYLERGYPMAKWLSVFYRGATQYVPDAGAFPQGVCDEMVARLGAIDPQNWPKVCQVEEADVPAWARPASAPRSALGSAVVAVAERLPEVFTAVPERRPLAPSSVRAAQLPPVSTPARVVPVAATENGQRATADREAATAAGFAPKRPMQEIGTSAYNLQNIQRARDKFARLPLASEACDTMIRKVRAEDRVDTVVRMADLKMNHDGSLRVPGIDEPIWLDPETMSALVGRYGFGGGAYLAAVWPKLRSANVNVLANKAGENGTGGEVKFRHRLGPAGREVYAVVSPSYTAHDADQIAEAFSLALPREARGTLHYDGKKSRFECWFETTVQPKDFVAGEFFRAGVIGGTDDTGGGSIWGSACAEQHLCANMSIIDSCKAGAFRVRHVGNPQRIARELRTHFREVQNKLDHFVNAWGLSRRDDVRAEVKAAEPKARDLGTELFYRGLFRNLVERDLVTVRGAPEEAIRGLVTAHERNNDSAPEHSRAAVANAVTRWAHEGPAAADPWWHDQLAREGSRLILDAPRFGWSDPEAATARRR